MIIVYRINKVYGKNNANYTLMTFFDINLMNFISVCDSTKFLVFEYFLRLPSH